MNTCLLIQAPCLIDVTTKTGFTVLDTSYDDAGTGKSTYISILLAASKTTAGIL